MKSPRYKPGNTNRTSKFALARLVESAEKVEAAQFLRSLTPYESVGHLWTKEPERFRLNPLHHTPGALHLGSGTDVVQLVNVDERNGSMGLDMRKQRLGFIGIGLMGEAMTRRLLDTGYEVTVWNLEPERLDTVVPYGARPAASPAAVTVASDVVLMCVLHTAAVESCVFGPRGIALEATPDRLLIDLSTADPAATRDMAQRLKQGTGMSWVDAPVSGGPPAARDGTMTVMAGGSPEDIDKVRPLMEDMAGNFTHMGPSGAGQTTKMINQAIVGTGYVLMAEALALAERAGIDAARLPQALAGGHADSNLLRKLYPQMQARDFAPPRSYARQLLKDMKAVKEFAHELGLDLGVVEAAAEQYADFVARGNEMSDSASVIRLYEAS